MGMFSFMERYFNAKFPSYEKTWTKMDKETLDQLTELEERAKKR